MENKTVERPLGSNCKNDAEKNMPDYQTWGNSDTFKLIAKFSSENAGIMKSTKAMQVGNSVIIQVTTQQRNPDGSFSVAEALTTIDNAHIIEKHKDNKCIDRKVVGLEEYNELVLVKDSEWKR